ncbi:hypothetical protein L4X63_18720 [Geomonas sp. Red32]|uniref:hypothetical protein n=1 Tax=Geomonas sp. Red32 TaxID=2912856 RepID=UPI00202CC23E|nr:hypothetical protein [Geomonas sp. Red32]MCM0083623.1 hypothetical protein [Geomonas sp. Red32]
MSKLSNLIEHIRRIALAVVDLIVRFKRSTEKLFLPHEGRVKPEGDIALDALTARFPRYLRAAPGHVVCGRGWYPLVWDLCTAIEALEHLAMPKVGTVQAEERLGGLFIKIDSPSLLVRELARDIEHKAAATCEECGAAGSLRLGHGFAKTLCPDHAKIRKRPYHKMGELEPGQKTRLLFLDAEFTDLEYPQLISIALVADSGESFYCELANGWSPVGCSGFVLQNVLPLLTGGEFMQERSYAGPRLSQWVTDFGCPVRVVSDAPRYDWVLMLDLLLEAVPVNLCPAPITFYSDSFPELVPLLQEARAKSLQSSEGSQHHALFDAQALREAWEVMRLNVHPAILDQYLRQY